MAGRRPQRVQRGRPGPRGGVTLPKIAGHRTRLPAQLAGAGVDRVLRCLEIHPVLRPVTLYRCDLLPGSQQVVDIGWGRSTAARPRFLGVWSLAASAYEA